MVVLWIGFIFLTFGIGLEHKCFFPWLGIFLVHCFSYLACVTSHESSSHLIFLALPRKQSVVWLFSSVLSPSRAQDVLHFQRSYIAGTADTSWRLKRYSGHVFSTRCQESRHRWHTPCSKPPDRQAKPRGSGDILP